MMRCRCIKSISDYGVGDMHEYNTHGDHILVGQVNSKLYWVITKCEFDRWFIDISSDRDRKIMEVLGG